MKTVYNTKLILIRGLLIIFLLNIFIPSSAQFEATILEDDSISNIDNNYTEIPEYGSSIEDKAPDFRIPSEKKIDEFQNDKRFQYEKTDYGAYSNWFYKIIIVLLDIIKDFFDGVNPITPNGLVDLINVLKIIGIIAVISIIILIILKLKGRKFRSKLGKKKLDTPPIDIYSENVHEMDFNTLIENALKNKDYRLVIRFMYLKNLKKLTDNGIINWSINKTNYSYQHEINDQNLRSRFLDTTIIFDYVWYGEFPINENNFSKACDELNQFNKMIGK